MYATGISNLLSILFGISMQDAAMHCVGLLQLATAVAALSRIVARLPLDTAGYITSLLSLRHIATRDFC